jgi:hypothetical protein
VRSGRYDGPERNDAAIAAWLKQVYPAIARQAKAEHAAI